MCDLSDAYEPAEIFRDEWRRARKEHRCGACNGRIMAGERYIAHFQLFEGDASYSKCCSACAEIRGRFADAHEGAITSPEGLSYMLADCVADGDEDSQQWQADIDAMRERGERAKS